MATDKKPWREPQIKSIDDLSLAYGAACTPTGSAPTTAGGNCNNGKSATQNCLNGSTPSGQCNSGAGVLK